MTVDSRRRNGKYRVCRRDHDGKKQRAEHFAVPHSPARGRATLDMEPRGSKRRAS